MGDPAEKFSGDEKSSRPVYRGPQIDHLVICKTGPTLSKTFILPPIIVKRVNLMLDQFASAISWKFLQLQRSLTTQRNKTFRSPVTGREGREQ